jgi:colanic acid/amylovoran biosynthesis protein
MKKVLILDIGNGLNKGNLALLYSAINTIKIYSPTTEFSLMYYGADGSHSNLDIKEQHLIAKVLIPTSIEKIKDILVSLLYLFKCSFIYIFGKLGVRVPISNSSRLFFYYDSDLVIVIGGDTMSPGGKLGLNILTPFTNIMYAVLLNKPVVLYGESIGYYNNRLFGSIAKFVFNRVRLILVREELSKKYLDENGINIPEIHVTADSAFLLDPSPEKQVLDILSSEGIPPSINGPIIGFNTSKLISNYKGGTDHRKDEEETLNVMVKTIDNLVENLNANIILIPHVYSDGNKTDDRDAIFAIFEKVKNKSKVFMIKNEYSPQELKGIIGKCDLFIGGRMHSTIAATSMLVPTVGIAYSHKMYGIIGNMLGQKKYIVDIKELSYEKLISTIYDAWNNKLKIKGNLESIIPVVKERALLNGKYVSELLEKLH